MISPMILATNASGLAERRWLASRLHLHTVLTNFATRDGNLSQNTEINESIFVFRRSAGPHHPPTRIIALDRFPADEHETETLHSHLRSTETGTLPDGWGEISHWPAERVASGDWTAAVWRSPVLAAAAAEFADFDELAALQRERERERERDGRSTRPTQRSALNTAERRTRETETSDGSRHAAAALRRLPQGGQSARGTELAVHATGQQMRGDYQKQATGDYEPFPVLQSKGADGQQRIEAVPDDYWEWKKPGKPPILEKAGHLLVSMGHQLSTARLTAVASDERYVGQGWMPVTGLDAEEAKAAAVYLNSTPGRLLILRRPGKTLRFPFYNPAVWRDLPIPDLEDGRIRETLAACWEATRHVEVPQFRDGYCDVRRSWDEAGLRGTRLGCRSPRRTRRPTRPGTAS